MPGGRRICPGLFSFSELGVEHGSVIKGLGVIGQDPAGILFRLVTDAVQGIGTGHGFHIDWGPGVNKSRQAINGFIHTAGLSDGFSLLEDRLWSRQGRASQAKQETQRREKQVFFCVVILVPHSLFGLVKEVFHFGHRLLRIELFEFAQ